MTRSRGSPLMGRAYLVLFQGTQTQQLTGRPGRLQFAEGQVHALEGQHHASRGQERRGQLQQAGEDKGRPGDHGRDLRLPIFGPGTG